VSTVESTRITHPDGLWARAGNLLLAGWLVVSALALQPGGPARVDALTVGSLVYVFGVASIGVDGARLLNALLGLWLVAAAWLFQDTRAMRWSTVRVGAGVACLSLVSREGAFRPPRLRLLAR
jgi:hypothetical protein